MEKSVFKPLDKALKVAQQGDDPLAFEQALEHLAMAFRRSFAAWRSLS
jgi:hypothetical protein